MNLKRAYIEAAIRLLGKRGIVTVFHRDGKLYFDGLACNWTSSSQIETVSVYEYDITLDTFAAFVAGYELEETADTQRIRSAWREICHTSGRVIDDSNHLVFASPTVMVVFNKHATKLQELLAEVPATVPRNVKSPEARYARPAAILRPTEIQHIQKCVQWAVKCGLNLTVFGGGHSVQCLRSNVIAIDMSALDQIHIVSDINNRGGGLFAVVQSGCKSGVVISKGMEQGVTVPLGARPSVGAGLWLQGGIGHVSRLHGLACDSVVGAVLVSVETAELLVVGDVPSEHIPDDAVRPSNEDEVLWAVKGAGTNFGVVVSVVFKTFPAPLAAVSNWFAPSSGNAEAASTLVQLDEISQALPPDYSLDGFLYHHGDQLQIGVTLFRTSSTQIPPDDYFAAETRLSAILGPKNGPTNIADSVQLFDADMYVSGMHGGHGGGKTSAFKRCVFLKSIGEAEVVSTMLSALERRPLHMSYMHLLHGGGAVSRIPRDVSAFGCRDWEYVCVITGVWARDLDGSQTARDVAQWVYDTAKELLRFGVGVYGADLGQDSRDAALAVEAFGRNRIRLAWLKHRMDPHDILAYACPLPGRQQVPRLILLITGETRAGKDFCAGKWNTFFGDNGVKASVASISDVTKKEYAAAVAANPERLLVERAYKEQHRPALTTFYHNQVKQRPWLPEEHFLHVVYSAAGVDVLLITGMRDEAPVAAFSHLVSDSRVLEVRVYASGEARHKRGGSSAVSSNVLDGKMSTAVSYQPDLTFNNGEYGEDAAKLWAQKHLLPFFDPKLQRLSDMVRSVSDFPRRDVEFRHVLDIVQHPGGLPLSTSLLRSHFNGHWSKIDAIVACETGGFLLASPLATQVDRPLALVREAGKLPPPVASSLKGQSHISELSSRKSRMKTMEIARDVIREGHSVVVVDDVLASGRTLCAVLQLLGKVGISMENITIMVVAEFSVHRAREHLRQQGYGGARIQSLLVFGGA